MELFYTSDVPGCFGPFARDQDVAELSILLPRAHALALMEAAERQRVTVAQLLRLLVGRALAELAPPSPNSRFDERPCLPW
jgi:hypothetical protein